MKRKLTKQGASARARGKRSRATGAAEATESNARATGPAETAAALPIEGSATEGVVAAMRATVAPSKPPSVTFTTALSEQPAPHLLLRASGVIDEDSVSSFFERVSPILAASKAKRILVDLRECNVILSISDMHGLVKMAARGFSGLVDRLALVLKNGDILPEKFFEPALTSRGLPTFATTDYDEALYWIAAKLRPGG